MTSGPQHPQLPLAIKACTATSALGRGCAAHLHALEQERGGLSANAFEDCRLPTWIGAVAGLDAPLAGAFHAWDCRNNRLAEAGLREDDFLPAVAAARERYGADRIAVYMGTSTSGVRQTELAYRAAADDDGSLPEWFNYQTTQNVFSVADYVRSRLQLKGHSVSISTACSSSAKVFAAAARAIGAGLADAAVVGGVDSLCLTTLYGFNALQLLSAAPCRPADVARNGLSIGEAAGFVLLERDNSAPLQLLSYGESNDAHHMTAPHPDGRGAVEAMHAALARAHLQPRDVDYINLHGTGTRANDAAESKAVETLFGRSVPCSSTKGWTGHTLGAAGILEAVISLMCIRTGVLPRSLNTRSIDPEIGINILMESRTAPLRHVLSNSFGFGGTNCSLLFGASA